MMKPLYTDGPEVNLPTWWHLPVIIDVLEEAGWDPDGLCKQANEAMLGSTMHLGFPPGHGTHTMQDCIITYLASVGDSSRGLPGICWPGVTPIDDETQLPEERDGLALAMYRGYIDWTAVATAVYWTSYVGEGWDSLRAAHAATAPARPGLPALHYGQQVDYRRLGEECDQ